MAKKFAKTLVGIGAAAVAGKVAYDKYKTVKEAFTKEENESVDAEVKKYNAIFEKKVVEVEDEEFSGCEIKTVGAKAVLDLGLAVFEKDVYINFNSTASTLTIILPEGVNVACDIEKSVSSVKNLVDNVDEEGIHTVYVIGKAVGSSIEIIPVNFYMDDDDDFEDTLYPVKELKDTLKQVAQQVDLTIEMGRFFTAECGTYYTNVADLKTVGNAHYCILDGGMNHLTYLGQMMGMKTPIIKHYKNAMVQDGTVDKKTWCLCGSLCTTSDILCREVEFEHLEIGDTLAFENVGAYSVTEGIYLFLSRTMPKVYLKDESGSLTLVRDAIETSTINTMNI